MVLRGWSRCTKRVNFPGLQGSQSKSADIINFIVLPNQCAQIRCANCSCKLDKSSETDAVSRGTLTKSTESSRLPPDPRRLYM